MAKRKPSDANDSPRAFRPFKHAVRRVHLLKREDCVDKKIADDLANERLFQSSVQISSSWDSFGVAVGARFIYIRVH